MEKTLEIIKSLVDKGIICDFAIGGGIAAAYYGEPTMTYDLDLFVFFPTDKDDLRVLTPAYEYLTSLGYKTKGDGILIEGILVQLLPAYNSLIEEAVKDSVTVSYGSTKARIFSLEHLLAVMIQTFRPKDKIRLVNLMDLIKVPGVKVRLDANKLSEDPHSAWAEGKMG